MIFNASEEDGYAKYEYMDWYLNILYNHLSYIIANKNINFKILIYHYLNSSPK